MVAAVAETRALGESEWLQRALGLADTYTGKAVTLAEVRGLTAVGACVGIKASTIASLPLVVYRRLPNGGKQRAPDHRLYAILHDAPNPEMTSFNFRQALVGHLALRGNAYAEIQRDQAERIVGLWPLHPDRMTVERTDGRLRYVYQLPDKRVGLASHQVMHWRGLSTDGVLGLSPIADHRQALAHVLAIEEYGARFFGNDSRPGGILTHPGQLPKSAKQNLKESWEEAHRGLDNRHRVAVLEEGVTWQQIGVAPEDAQFIESMKYGAIKVCQIFRVPPHLIYELDRATNNNIEHQSIEWVRDGVRPDAVNIEQSVYRDLFSVSEGKRSHFAEFLLDGLLRGDAKTRSEALAIQRQNGIINADDWNEIENRNPLPDGQGQVYWAPANMLPADQFMAPGRSGSATQAGAPMAGVPVGQGGAG